MITCSVCQTENDEYATVCGKCKSFIQNRISNLDFFDTVWKVIESPHRAFHDITLSDHKNYALLMFTFFGIGLSFTGFWYYQLGSRFESLLEILGRGTLYGVVLGYVCAILFTGLFHGISRLLGGKGGIRNSLGVLGYATTPVALSLITILPIELLTFGMYMFTANPHPYTIKPELYVTLVAVDGALGLWALALGVVGTKVSKQMSYSRSFFSIVSAASCSFGVLAVASRWFMQHV